MRLGLGKLLWSPAVFWSSTIIELEAASEGLAEFHGTKDEDGTAAPQPLSSLEFAALREKLDG